MFAHKHINGMGLYAYFFCAFFLCVLLYHAIFQTRKGHSRWIFHAKEGVLDYNSEYLCVMRIGHMIWQKGVQL